MARFFSCYGGVPFCSSSQRCVVRCTHCTAAVFVSVWCGLFSSFCSAIGIATPRITHVDGYPIGWLREPLPGTPAPAASYTPTNAPQRPPSMRVLYRPVWRPDDFGGVALGGGINNNLTSDGVSLLIISGDGLATATAIQAKLIDSTASDCATGAIWNPLGAAAAPGIL